jgi:hypothetical protein
MSSSIKPTNLDASRVLQVLDELKESLTVFSVLTPEVVAKLNSDTGRDTANKLGEYVMDLINEHQRLLEAATLDAPRVSDSHESTPVVRATLEVSRRVPAEFVPELRGFQTVRPQGLLNFLRTMLDLQTVVWKKISSTVEEDRNRTELITNFLALEKSSLVQKNQLIDQLAKFRDERHAQNIRHSQTLASLRSDLGSSLAASDDKQAALEAAHVAESARLTAAFNTARTKADAEHAALVTALNLQRETLSAETENLRKIKNRKTTDVEHLIGSYDDTVQKVAQEISDLRRNLAREEAELETLRADFLDADTEFARIAEEQCLEDARLRKLRNERLRLDNFASTFQAYWKGVLGREEFVKLKKAAKKGVKKPKK